MKRFLSMAIAAILLISSMSFAFAEESESTLLTDKPVTITYMRAENAAIPVQNDVPSTRQIFEKTGIQL